VKTASLEECKMTSNTRYNRQKMVHADTSCYAESLLNMLKHIHRFCICVFRAVERL